MPTQEGRRGDEEGDPAVTWDDPACGGEEDPVDEPEPGRARRPLQHPKLMAEDEDLEVLGSVLALLATADEETDEGAGDEVEERPHRPIVPGLSERESGFLTPTGSLKRITPSKTRSCSSRDASSRLAAAPPAVGARSSSAARVRDPTATSRNPSVDASSTSFARPTCSVASIGRAEWSSRTWLERAMTASGAPFVTRSGGSPSRCTTTLRSRREKS